MPQLTRRQALKLLASSQHGINAELLMRDHGFSRRMLAGLRRAGLAAAEREMTAPDDGAIEVIWIRITPAGRRALAGS